ncbi:SDR family NAD(P)-dependent oxidoreductase [Novosphingobium sp. G106]|uniref:SDR family NAD(P)-dependent oxidoreductase n=1 Tax=Novosphingobium sp. G106 TaxID=2849500 RepID=UPI001C2D7A24|nr:SDR family NAD(P)-dependent oxidoreductase [Novosphingobium sp. G106]MBV1687841.1 SDR family NAD(P)-dependent oxidoreductase [Novosphingobium sp. G106]
MLEEFRLDGRVAVVTGSARGLGFEIARGMAAAGARVYINGTSDERLEAAARRLQGLGVEVAVACFDVTDETLAARSLDKIACETGRLDILVNNVGVRMREPLEHIGSAELRRMLDVDLVSAFTLAKLAAPVMGKGGYGRIINVSSIAALRGRVGDAAYIIVKGAMNAMTRSLAAEFGPLGITCNALMPGGFLTETNENLKTPEMERMFKTRMPLGRAGNPP